MSTYSCIACQNLGENFFSSHSLYHSYHTLKPTLTERSTFEGLSDDPDQNITIGLEMRDFKCNIEAIHHDFESADEDQKNQPEQENASLDQFSQRYVTEGSKTNESTDQLNVTLGSKLQSIRGNGKKIKKAGPKLKLNGLLKTFYPKLKSYLYHLGPKQSLPKSITNKNVGSIIAKYQAPAYQYLSRLSSYNPNEDKPSQQRQREKKRGKIAFKNKADQLIDKFCRVNGPSQ